VIEVSAFNLCVSLERVVFEGSVSLVNIDRMAFEFCPHVNSHSLVGMDDCWHSMQLTGEGPVCVFETDDERSCGADQALIDFLLF
jgi:hypothetical protein